MSCRSRANRSRSSTTASPAELLARRTSARLRPQQPANIASTTARREQDRQRLLGAVAAPAVHAGRAERARAPPGPRSSRSPAQQRGRPRGTRRRRTRSRSARTHRSAAAPPSPSTSSTHGIASAKRAVPAEAVRPGRAGTARRTRPTCHAERRARPLVRSTTSVNGFDQEDQPDRRRSTRQRLPGRGLGWSPASAQGSRRRLAPVTTHGHGRSHAAGCHAGTRAGPASPGRPSRPRSRSSPSAATTHR